MSILLIFPASPVVISDFPPQRASLAIRFFCYIPLPKPDKFLLPGRLLGASGGFCQGRKGARRYLQWG